MIPCVGVTIGGVTYYPLYNIQAMFRMQDDLPEDFLEKITDNTKASFELAFRIFSILCEEGEAVRVHYGYERSPLPDWEEAQWSYLPADITAMKNAVFAAVMLGLKKEVDLDEEVDLILLELKKKNE